MFLQNKSKVKVRFDPYVPYVLHFVYTLSIDYEISQCAYMC
jgi:hypothetical protein